MQPLSSRSLAALVALATLAAPSPAAARDPVATEIGNDWTLTVNGQVRPRFYSHTGRDFKEGSELREHVTQRARIGATLEELSGLALTVQLQDVRVWGEESDTLNDFSANGLDMHQAVATIPLGQIMDLKIGRQELSLDDQRLIGAVDWSQRARAFDGVRLSRVSELWGYSFDLFYAKIREAGTSPDGSVPSLRKGDTDLALLHTSMRLLPPLTLAPLYVFRSNAESDERRHTLGGTLSLASAGLDASLQGYYQLGRLQDANIKAFMGALRARYTFGVERKPFVLGWAEWLSGGGTKATAFDTLYATNHKFYGEMDYFLNIPLHTGNAGLVDLGGSVGSTLVDGLRAQVDFHHFRRDPRRDAPSVFGNEVNVIATIAFSDYVELRNVYGLFLPSEAMRAVLDPARPTGRLSPDSMLFVTLDVSF